MKRPVHISWFIAWLSTGILIGIGMSAVRPGLIIGSVWLIGALAIFIGSLAKRRRLFLPLALIAGVLIGYLRGSIGQVELQAYLPLQNQNVVLSGVVAEDGALGVQGEQQLKLNRISTNGRNLPGTVWIGTEAQAEIKRSDRVTVEGKLSEGFGNFPAAIYSARLKQIEKIEHADVGREIRDGFAERLRRVVSEPAASLGLGYLAGLRTALPEDLSNNLKILGLTHIVVASGYNLSIMVRTARRLLAPVSKYLSVLTGGLLAIGMILVTGFSPSMTRAGLVTGLALAAWYFGRAIHPLVLLSLAAAVTALLNPAFVWGDIGWYLSFTAFGGVIVLSPLLIHYFFGKKRINGVLQIVFETTSAQLATAPIIAFVFGQYAPLAIISNMLILPLVPFAMLFTFIAGLGNLLVGSNWFGQLLANPAQVILDYMLAVVDKLSQVPLAVAEVSFNLAALIGMYALLVVLVVYLTRRTKHDFTEDNIVE